MSLNGKVAIVTGATGSLGSVVAARLNEEGAIIAMPLRREATLASLPLLLRKRTTGLFPFQVDLTEEAQVTRFVDQVINDHQRIDILVNCAGGYAGGQFIEDVSLRDWDSILRLNLLTTFLICKASLKAMKQKGWGRIINIAAKPALSPAAKKGPYTVSKSGVISLTETIAEEVKGGGITANAIAPSIILTEENRASMPEADTRKWVTPEEIAGLVSFLCTEDARSISGNVIKVFGGV